MRSSYVVPTLFLAVFLDSLGAALIIPLLGPMFLNETGGILPVGTAEEQRNLLYGVSLGIFSLCMFLSSPILGSLSDRLGRKRVLMFCLGGSLAGYVLSAAAIVLAAPGLFLFARVLDGLTTGSMPIAQASLFDVSEPERKMRNVGRMMMAASLGYILAPLIGGVLSDSSLVSWFSLTTPFYSAAALTLGNLILLQVLLQETHPPQPQARIDWLASMKSLAAAFQMPGLRRLAIPFFFMQLGWNTYFQFLGLFLTRQHGFTSEQVGLFLSLIGVGFAITFGTLVGIFAKHVPVGRLAMAALVVMGATIASVVLTRHTALLWVVALPGAIGLGTGFSTFVTLFSGQADSTNQGLIMGIVAAISAFCAGITGLLSGFTANLGAAMPMWMAFGCIVLSALTLLGLRMAPSPAQQPDTTTSIA